MPFPVLIPVLVGQIRDATPIDSARMYSTIEMGCNSPHLGRTIRTYRWLRASRTGVNPRDARPEPLKKDDHAVDALRYMVFSEANVTASTPESIQKNRDPRRFGIQAVLERRR